MRQLMIVAALALLQPTLGGACDLHELPVIGHRVQAGKSA
jgi:hypothetical protein